MTIAIKLWRTVEKVWFPNQRKIPYETSIINLTSTETTLKSAGVDVKFIIDKRAENKCLWSVQPQRVYVDAILHPPKAQGPSQVRRQKSSWS